MVAFHWRSATEHADYIYMYCNRIETFLMKQMSTQGKAIGTGVVIRVRDKTPWIRQFISVRPPRIPFKPPVIRTKRNPGTIIMKHDCSIISPLVRWPELGFRDSELRAGDSNSIMESYWHTASLLFWGITNDALVISVKLFRDIWNMFVWIWLLVQNWNEACVTSSYFFHWNNDGRDYARTKPYSLCKENPAPTSCGKLYYHETMQSSQIMWTNHSIF